MHMDLLRVRTSDGPSEMGCTFSSSPISFWAVDHAAILKPVDGGGALSLTLQCIDVGSFPAITTIENIYRDQLKSMLLVA